MLRGSSAPNSPDGPIVSAATGPFPQIDYTLFAAYDKNANGVLDLGEIAQNDEHLHRVLNLDGKAGIAPTEFYSSGRMIWNYMKDKSLKTGTDGYPTKATYETISPAHLVIFDLSNINAPILNVTTPHPKPQSTHETTKAHAFKSLGHTKTTTTTTSHTVIVNRTIGWVHGHSTPSLTFTDYDYRVRYTS